MHESILLLDGPVGTELAARSVPTTLPLWSAHAIDHAPQVLAAIHRDYADAGATLHTACTFRTQPRWMGASYERAARKAVAIAREAIAPSHRLAGSVAPVEDCYRPDLSPGLASRPEHRALVRTLADAGVDLLLCESFPAVTEAIVAVEEALATGLPTYLSLTAGPDANLLAPDELAHVAEQAARLGVDAVLVNCIAARSMLRYVEALASAGVRFGAYANAGSIDDTIGWASSAEPGAGEYVELARAWIDAGATIVGGCCGTGVAHVRALAEAFGPNQPR